MLTDRFSQALVLAERLHRSQRRKGNDIPYVAHLLGAASLVLEWGGSEDAAVAALLHDAVEDQGGEATSALIAERFGQAVQAIVLACTDSKTNDPAAKRPWEERKREHVAAMAAITHEAALVSAADKLHNLAAMVRDVRRDGPESLRRFARPDRISWYYGAMADALEPKLDRAITGEIRMKLAELDGLLATAEAA